MQESTRIERLRDIAFNVWDPLDFTRNRSGWNGAIFADRYDAHLEHAAGLIERSGSVDEAAAYLFESETADFGRTGSIESRKRAVTTAKSVKYMLGRVVH